MRKAEIQERDGVLCYHTEEHGVPTTTMSYCSTSRMVRTFIRLLWNMGLTFVHLGEVSERDRKMFFFNTYLYNHISKIIMYHSVACYKYICHIYRKAV